MFITVTSRHISRIPITVITDKVLMFWTEHDPDEYTMIKLEGNGTISCHETPDELKKLIAAAKSCDKETA